MPRLIFSETIHGRNKLRNNTWNNAYCLEDIMGEDDKVSENIFRDLFNSINDPMYLANINQDGSPGRFQAVNEAACRVLGYTREELLNLSPRDINIPSNHCRFSNDFFHELRSNGRMTYEATHLSKLGESIPIEANASVLHYKNQHYYVVIARNISKRKLAEQALEASESRYRRIIETTQEGFGEIDLAGRIISTNAHLHQMFGYPQDEMIGLNMIEDLLFPEDQPMMYERQKGRRQGQAGAYDQRFRTKTGGTMWAIVTATPVRNTEGIVCGSFAMMTDITERKRAEEALKISERSLSEAQQLAHIGNWKWTVETDEVQWSKELYRITGLNPELPPPAYADMGSIYSKESWELLKQAVAVTVSLGTSYELELDMVRPDGQFRCCNTRGIAIKDESGRVIYLSGTVQDITACKQDEKEKAEIKAQLVLSSKLASIGTLAAGVAHEIGNPLAIIKSNIDRLRGEITIMSGNISCTEILDNQSKAVDRVGNIVNSLRNFARADSDNIEIIDLNEITNDTLALYRQRNITKENTEAEAIIQKRLAPELPHFKGNIIKLQQVIMNFLSKANDACDGKHQDQRITIETLIEGPSVVLKITDNGADNSAVQGTAISHSVIQSFGGTLNIEDRQGVGTSVVIKFPILPTDV